MINLKPTTTTNIPSIMSMERHSDNNDFVGQSTAQKHQKWIEGDKAEHLSIFSKSNELVGFILLIHEPENSFELKRIVIAKKGKGYGQAALEAIKKYAFENLKAKRLWLDVFDFNQRAIHVYQKLGFKTEITKYESIIFKGEKRNQVIMSIENKKI